MAAIATCRVCLRATQRRLKVGIRSSPVLRSEIYRYQSPSVIIARWWHGDSTQLPSQIPTIPYYEPQEQQKQRSNGNESKKSYSDAAEEKIVEIAERYMKRGVTEGDAMNKEIQETMIELRKEYVENPSETEGKGDIRPVYVSRDRPVFDV